MSEENGPPAGWARATLGQLVCEDGVFCDGDWVESEDQDSNGDVRLIQLADVGDGAFRDRSNRFLTSDKARELSCTYLATGDVLVARMPDPLGRAAIFPGDGRTCVTVVDVCIARSGKQGVNHRWLMWFINSPRFRSEVAKLQSGSTRQRISRKNLATIALPVPPVREQERIASEIDELLSDLDAGVAALERARANLKKYRAAVLKAAVTGDLTADWRAAHPNVEPASALLDRILTERRQKWEADQQAKFTASGKTPPKGWNEKYVEPAAPNTATLSALPSKWAWATLDMLVYGSPQNGAYYPRQLYGTGTPIVRIDDYQDFSSRSSAELQQVNCPNNDVGGYAVQVGDILINRVNSPSHLGKCLLIEERHTPALFESNMMRFRLSEGVQPAYIRDYLRSPDGRSRLVANAKWAVNQASINQQDVLGTPVSLPLIAEQDVIAAEVAEQLSVIAATENYIDASLKRAAKLRQSILKEAFAGRLVPQDPSDEPASVLLDRIRQSRAVENGAAPARPRGRKKADSPTPPE